NVTHAFEQYSLTELELLFLQYKSSPVVGNKKPLSATALAKVLNGLDFVEDHPRRKLHPTTLQGAIAGIREFLANREIPDADADPDPANAASRERLQIKLSDVSAYPRSPLLTVSRPKRNEAVASGKPPPDRHSYSRDLQLPSFERRMALRRAG